MLADVAGIAISVEEGEAIYIPVTGSSRVSLKKVAGLLENVFQSAGIRVGHNVKRDLILLARSSVSLDGPFFDTMIADYLLSPDQSHSLPVVARRYLDIVATREDDILGTGRNRSSFLDIPRADLGRFACEQVDITGRLVPVMQDSLEENDLASIASEIEFPLLEVLADMEMAGISIDTGVLERISNDMANDLAAVEKEIFEQREKSSTLAHLHSSVKSCLRSCRCPLSPKRQPENLQPEKLF